MRFSPHKFWISENRPTDHIGVLQTPINGTHVVAHENANEIIDVNVEAQCELALRKKSFNTMDPG